MTNLTFSIYHLAFISHLSFNKGNAIMSSNDQMINDKLMINGQWSMVNASERSA